MIHEALFTLIALGLLLGAMAKSAQIGLHTWLPNAMEGSRIFLPALFGKGFVPISFCSGELIQGQNRALPFVSSSFDKTLETPLYAGIPLEPLVRACNLDLSAEGQTSSLDRQTWAFRGKPGPKLALGRWGVRWDRNNPRDWTIRRKLF